jgi:nucleoside-diphosphate-sugar epimerase
LENSGSKNWTIIRPYITYGRYRLQLGVLEKEEWLFRALGGRTVILSSAMQQKITTMTHGHDVANGIAALVGQQSAYGNIFHITNAQSYSWKEVYEMYAQAFKKVTGKELRICLADANTFFLTRPTIYQIEYDRMFDRHFNNSKISAYVDVGGFIDLCLGIEQEMKRFIEEPQFENIYWKLEARKDRFLKEKTRFSEIPGFLNKGRYFAFRYLAI